MHYFFIIYCLFVSSFLKANDLEGHASTTVPVGMVFIQGGTYTPLYRENDSILNIAVADFYLDQFHVTNADYKQFLHDNPRWAPETISRLFADPGYLNHWLKQNNDPHSPVTNISWYSAMAYCSAQGKTLPSVDQWEYVAQASADQANGLNEEGFKQKILSWYARPATEQPIPVNHTPANYWGVHGMHGVVWEQVKDFNTTLGTGESRGDSALDQQLFCGAGASLAVDPGDYAAFMRYAFRSSYQASYTLSSMGFRCAKDIDTSL